MPRPLTALCVVMLAAAPLYAGVPEAVTRASNAAAAGLVFDGPLAGSGAATRSADGGLLVGFHFGVGRSSFGHDEVYAAAPVYLTAAGESVSGDAGRVPGVRQVRVVTAQPGFAVGGLRAVSGYHPQAVQLKFHRVRVDDLDPDDYYFGPVVGLDPRGSFNVVVEGNGTPSVGLLSRQRGDGRLSALSLVFVRPDAPRVRPPSVTPTKSRPDPAEVTVARSKSKPSAPAAETVAVTQAAPTTAAATSSASATAATAGESSSASPEWLPWAIFGGVTAVVLLLAGLASAFGREPAATRQEARKEARDLAASIFKKGKSAKADAAKRPDPPPRAEAERWAAPLERASFGARVGAYLLDVIFVAVTWVLLLIPATFVAVANGWLPSLSAGEKLLEADNIRLGLLGMTLTQAAWFLVLSAEALVGRSPGKWLMGMKIAGADGGPGDVRLLVRSLLKFGPNLVGIVGFLTEMPLLYFVGSLGGLVMFLGYFAALANDRQALHDMFAGTTVYRVRG